jgi:heme/copper-type cytochrome/quinol oxidase subunit 3
MSLYHFTRDGHFGYEACIWYWHFVDVVWVFLYFFVYWWGIIVTGRLLGITVTGIM